MDLKSIPIFFICRDTVVWLRQMVDWLVELGYENIILIDNDSEYPPLLEYYEQTPHTVVFQGENLRQYSPWSHDRQVLQTYADNQYYIVTDPDILPIEECPDDFVDHFYQALQRYSHKDKVGFGLRIDDLPDHYVFKDIVIRQHSKFWGKPSVDGFFDVPLDTTFAMYRPNTGHHIGKALRSDYPYVARHMAWYIDSADPPEDIQFYRTRAAGNCGHWAKEDLPQTFLNRLDRGLT